MSALTYDEIKTLVVANNQAPANYISDRLFVCLIWKESTFDPDLKNPRSTATGLMQLTKGAVAEVNRVNKTSFDHNQMTDSALNIQCGTAYLAILKKRKNDNLTNALDAFGTGSGYSKSIIACSLCMKQDDTHPMVCLHKIHT